MKHAYWWLWLIPLFGLLFIVVDALWLPGWLHRP